MGSFSSMAIVHFPFTREPFKAQMGLKVLDLKNWIEPDGLRLEQLELKAKLLREHRDTVLGVADEKLARPAALELHQILGEHLQIYHSSENCFAPVVAPDSVRTALEGIARWVQEDFCLLSPRDYTLMAGLVCFPSRWNLPEKIGKNSDAIHEPVAHFKSIAKPVAGALSQLSKPLVRFNWTIHDAPDLFSPAARHTPWNHPPAEVLARTYLRLERQTLRRLPASGAIAFSIRTYIHRMDEVVADPERRECMRATILSLPDEVAHYKGMRYFLADLRAAL